MKIKIVDSSICDSCLNKTCSYDNTPRVNQNFNNLPTEATVCPTGSTDKLGDGSGSQYIEDKNCVECGLCVKFCKSKNLEFEDLDNDISKFKDLTEQQLNAIVSQYLGCLFEFSANSNRNRAVSFDGYIKSQSGKEAFVETDWNDDSLECARRILGDILLFSNNNRLRTGVVVLSNLPKIGSRDVYNVLESLKQFPYTKEIKIYMTTIPVLKQLCLHTISEPRFEFDDVFYDYQEETMEQYIDKIDNLCNKTV